jgi:hypothetical protein
MKEKTLLICPKFSNIFPPDLAAIKRYKIKGFLKQDVSKKQNVSGKMHENLPRHHDILQKRNLKLPSSIFSL